jgi:hypothetical protein
MTVQEFERLPFLLRRAQVLKLTGIGPDALDVLRKEGTLKTMRMHREVRYFRESVRNFIGLQIK